MTTQSLRTSVKAEEALERLYVELAEGERRSLPLDGAILAGDREGLEELFQSELARLHGDEVELTPRGYDLAIQTIRRHRLAERLLVDVLEVRQEQMDAVACGIEHSLGEGVDEAVCTLLGHPERCPHDKPIPPGECCRRAAERAERAVAPLSRLRPGQSGRIAYVQTGEARKLHKLMAMGVLPGKTLRLVQGFPSYVFAVGHSQFAVDEGLARTIYVRLESA